MGRKHDYSKHQSDDKGNHRIRDNTINKWVMDGNGRQIRKYEDDVDEIIEILEDRTEEGS